MNGVLNRVQAGVPAGGQFANRMRAEADLILHDTATGYGDRVASTGMTADDLFDISVPSAGTSTASAEDVRSPLAVARTLHVRHCDACHGADPSCIQIEEQFLPAVHQHSQAISA